MAHFDRFDICEAYWLARPGRFCTFSFKARPSLRGPSDLSENALEIYAALCADAGTLEKPEHPIANTCNDYSETALYRMWAGSGYGATTVYVWADSFESAFEILTEWLDEHAPGCLVSHEEAHAELQALIDRNGGEVPEDIVDLCEAVEQANDWTVIGHTTLKHGMYIRSHEWGGDEIETGSDEYNTVLLAGTEAAQEHFRAEAVREAVAECEHALTRYSAYGAWAKSPSGSPSEYYAAYSASMRHAALVTLLCQGVTGDINHV